MALLSPAQLVLYVYCSVQLVIWLYSILNYFNFTKCIYKFISFYAILLFILFDIVHIMVGISFYASQPMHIIICILI